MKKFFIIFLLLVIILSLLSILLKIKSINYEKNNLVEIYKFRPFKTEEKKEYLELENDLPVIETASTFYPFGADLVEKIYSKHEYSDELKMVSTNKAYEDLILEKIDIAIVTAPSDEQKEKIKNSNISLKFETIFLEPLVIYVNEKNKIENLSLDQLKRIYKENCKWTEYGEVLENINTYQLEKNNGSQTCFETIVKNNILNKYHHEIKTMPEIIDKVGKDKNGIGYAFETYFSKIHINSNTKKIKIDGKTSEDINYPLLFEVYFVYREDNENENINKIIEYIKEQKASN